MSKKKKKQSTLPTFIFEIYRRKMKSLRNYCVNHKTKNSSVDVVFGYVKAHCDRSLSPLAWFFVFHHLG